MCKVYAPKKASACLGESALILYGTVKNMPRVERSIFLLGAVAACMRHFLSKISTNFIPDIRICMPMIVLVRIMYLQLFNEKKMILSIKPEKEFTKKRWRAVVELNVSVTT